MGNIGYFELRDSYSEEGASEQVLAKVMEFESFTDGGLPGIC